MPATKHLGIGLLLLVLLQGVIADEQIDYDEVIDYEDALQKILKYFEGQRSGKLPPNQRVTWRGDSALNDGKDNNIDLVGGYYDAGDNVKFGFTMAYAVTMLAWSVVDLGPSFEHKNELENTLAAIKWGTDYFIKAHPQPNVLYAQVGDGDSDHDCWQRPEDMTTPRTSYKIDEKHPGSDIAAQTAVALAAASMAFNKTDPNYSALLLIHGQQLFDFAKTYRGLYSNSVPSGSKFYPSSDDQDELLLAASWLYRATLDGSYLSYIDNYNGTGWIRGMFSWDDKYVGVQLNIAKLILDHKLKREGKWAVYMTALHSFLCHCMQLGGDDVRRSPGGLSWWAEWNNLQYTTSATFVATIYAKYSGWEAFECEHENGTPRLLLKYAQSQVQHMTKMHGMSYMVGFGTKYPTQIHHRGSSIVSIKTNPSPVSCKGGFDTWFNRSASNPNVLEGAVVGGPDQFDSYHDLRSNYKQAEASISIAAPLVGVLAASEVIE
ncbi:hypothetical protein AQUCO_03700052v1 [Aquilegia coerulea]|uniref:cellulase n=1 Tax=Aquilegia coerulea TaxID=218851 RepID=A0A2G5CT93_AQUCA|nr:hypothetical protein AQUCO_03700052v1 [Aquilegia coerulea]